MQNAHIFTVTGRCHRRNINLLSVTKVTTFEFWKILRNFCGFDFRSTKLDKLIMYIAPTMTATLFVVLVHIELRRARARLYATRTLCQWPKP